MPVPKVDVGRLTSSSLYGVRGQPESAIPAKTYESFTRGGVVITRRILRGGDPLPRSKSPRELPKWIFPDATKQESQALLEQFAGHPMSLGTVDKMTDSLCKMRTKIPSRYERPWVI